MGNDDKKNQQWNFPYHISCLPNESDLLVLLHILGQFLELLFGKGFAICRKLYFGVFIILDRHPFVFTDLVQEHPLQFIRHNWNHPFPRDNFPIFEIYDGDCIAICHFTHSLVLMTLIARSPLCGYAMREVWTICNEFLVLIDEGHGAPRGYLAIIIDQ
jgi:hypothetical protein